MSLASVQKWLLHIAKLELKKKKTKHTHIHTYLTKMACFKDIENDAHQKKYLLNLIIIFQILYKTDGTEQLASARFVMFSLVVMLAYK